MTAEPIHYRPGPAPAELSDLVDRSAVRAADLLDHWWDRVVADWSGTRAESGDIAEAGRPVGGKFLRARLAAAAYYGFGGTDDATPDRLGGAVQLLHAALCLHDDVIDGDDRRHGRPNVIGVVTRMDLARRRSPAAARRQGRCAAILVGDLLLAKAFQTLGGLDRVGATTRDRLAEEFHVAVGASIQGELLDVRGEWDHPVPGHPARIATLKTAAYSTVLPLRAGALAAGSQDEQTLRALRRIGECLGVAYQLADDELGLLGDETRTGKPTLGDLRAGKRTELIAHAYRLAGPDERHRLLALLGDVNLDLDGARQVIEIVGRTGALAHVRRLRQRLTADALRTADRALPAALAGYLHQLATSLSGRAA